MVIQDPVRYTVALADTVNDSGILHARIALVACPQWPL